MSAKHQKMGKRWLLPVCLLLVLGALGVNWLQGAIPRRGAPSECGDRLKTGFSAQTEQTQYPVVSEKHVLIVQRAEKSHGAFTNPIWLEVLRDGS